MIPNSRVVHIDPMHRLALHIHSCVYCRMTPQGQPSLCGQRLAMEADMGIVRASRSRKEQDRE